MKGAYKEAMKGAMDETQGGNEAGRRGNDEGAMDET